MMAEYNPMGLAVPKMDDNSPADMSTFFSDTAVSKASTFAIMITVTSKETTLTPTPVTTSGTIPSTSADGSSRHTEGRAGSIIMSRLQGLQLNVNQPQYDWDAPDWHKEFRMFHKHLISWFNL